VSAQAPPQTDLLLAMADDELVLGWRDSEWTGIAPLLEEDVALSSIAQGEIGHARALYELVATELGTTPDELAFDRAPDEYRATQLVELRLVPDWAGTVARRYLYEAADAIRVEGLKGSADPALAGLAEKMEREEQYHRMHAEMWAERLRDEPRFRAALEDLWPYALGLLDGEQRGELARRVEREPVEPVERGSHADDWPALWEEMTSVRRSVPGASW
jgi:ring-1,2-phenylacetyl-CoA epoxidase subunit PaaC